MNKNSKDCTSLEELKQNFSSKICLLRKSLELRKMDNASAEQLSSLNNETMDLRDQFEGLKDEVKAGKETLAKLKDLLGRLKELNKNLDYVAQNAPDILKKSSQKSATAAVAAPAAGGKDSKIQNKNSGKAEKIKVVREPPKIQPLSLDEFKTVPDYMKGRMKYDAINKFIVDFNTVISQKYQFLSKPKKELKGPDLKTWSDFKSLETTEIKNEGLYFCTSDDMKKYANLKSDKTTSNYLTILRHCKKMREIRGPGPIVRYVVIS